MYVCDRLEGIDLNWLTNAYLDLSSNIPSLESFAGDTSLIYNTNPYLVPGEEEEAYRLAAREYIYKALDSEHALFRLKALDKQFFTYVGLDKFAISLEDLISDPFKYLGKRIPLD